MHHNCRYLYDYRQKSFAAGGMATLPGNQGTRDLSRWLAIPESVCQHLSARAHHRAVRASAWSVCSTHNWAMGTVDHLSSLFWSSYRSFSHVMGISTLKRGGTILVVEICLNKGQCRDNRQSWTSPSPPG